MAVHIAKTHALLQTLSFSIKFVVLVQNRYIVGGRFAFIINGRNVFYWFPRPAYCWPSWAWLGSRHSAVHTYYSNNRAGGKKFGGEGDTCNPPPAKKRTLPLDFGRIWSKPVPSNHFWLLRPPSPPLQIFSPPTLPPAVVMYLTERGARFSSRST